MDFSEPFRRCGVVRFSPDGSKLALLDRDKVVVRDPDTLEVLCVRGLSEEGTGTSLQWSACSRRLLCALPKSAVCLAWQVVHDDSAKPWQCRIDEGLAGLSFCRWGPHGHHLLTICDFALRLTLWSLRSRQVRFIERPKFANGRGVVFSPNGMSLAVLHRREGKDSVAVFEVDSVGEDWTQVAHFAVPTRDAVDLVWTRDGRCLLLWDAITDYRVVACDRTGHVLMNYVPYEEKLGARANRSALSLSECGQLIALGAYDGTVRIINANAWTLAATLHHNVHASHSSTTVFREHAKEFAVDRFPTPSEWANLRVKSSPEQAFPPLGVHVVAFSFDSRYLLCVAEDLPTLVWIWDVERVRLSALLRMRTNVRSCAWQPGTHRVAVTTASDAVFFWSPRGCARVQVPIEGFVARSVHWNPEVTRRMCVLNDRTRSALLYVAQSDVLGRSAEEEAPLKGSVLDLQDESASDFDADVTLELRHGIDTDIDLGSNDIDVFLGSNDTEHSTLRDDFV